MKQLEFENILKNNKSYVFQDEKLEGIIDYNYFQGIGGDIKLDTIKFIGCEINTLKFNFIKFNELIFENCIINNIILSHVHSKKLEFKSGTRLNKILLHNSCSFNAIYFEADVLVDDYLEIYKNEIGALLLSGTVRKAYIETKINLLEIRFLKAIDYIKFANLESFSHSYNKRIKIAESNTKIIFSSCKFNSYNDIYLDNTDLSNVEFFNCIPTNISVDNKLSKRKTHSIKREYYKQIKSSFSSTNDFINRLHFQRLELNSYRKSLQLNWNNLGKLILLQLNRFSNYYGTRWYYGIAFTLFIGLFFFLLYSLTSPCSICTFDDFIKYLVLFLNPAHKFNFCNDSPNGYQVLIDSISRIFVSYGYYQTVQAFRIFGKN